ncbi:MAG: hypothetical protein QOJ28_3227 [Mycobacterium sp.]|nr:hypothetical protein [Mycobacterium sp.]
MLDLDACVDGPEPTARNARLTAIDYLSILAMTRFYPAPPRTDIA